MPDDNRRRLDWTDRSWVLAAAVIVACAGEASSGSDEDDGSGWDWFDDTPGDSGWWGDSGDQGDSGDAEGDADTDTDADPDVVVVWEDDHLRFVVEGCPDCRNVGLAETHSTCEGDESFGCWTGEDCLYGYESPDGSIYLDPYCHPLKDGSVRLAYGGDPLELDEARETVFPSADYRGLVTYYLESSVGECWVGGARPAYYNGLGCGDLTFDED